MPFLHHLGGRGKKKGGGGTNQPVRRNYGVVWPNEEETDLVCLLDSLMDEGEGGKK